MSAGPEDDLLVAVTDALALRTGFHPADVWQHNRRSDLSQLMGVAGIPDVVGVVGSTLIAWELKAERGIVSADQARWARALARVESIDLRIVRPRDLDGLLEDLLRDRIIGRRIRPRP